MSVAETNAESPEKLEVVIVGAGMSGLLMGIRLRQAGIDRFRIYEKASAIGGTWRENRYPGLSCDVPSFFYSYSFEPNLDWSHRFSPGPRSAPTSSAVAEKYDLLKHISFENPVESARYEEGRWSIETSGGETIRADVLIDGHGPASHQELPGDPGPRELRGDGVPLRRLGPRRRARRQAHRA